MKRAHALLFCLSCIALGGSTLYYGQQQQNQAQQQLQHAQQLHQQYQASLQQYQQQEQKRVLYQPDYLALQRLSTASEPRLMWLEQLRELSPAVKQLDFEIGPQQPYPGKTPDWPLHYSPLKLQLSLLHEQQLLQFFHALQQSIPQWYQLDSCSLQRTGHPDRPLRAHCQGGWITLQEKI